MKFSAMLNGTNRQDAAKHLGEICNGCVYPASIQTVKDGLIFLSKQDREKRVHTLGAHACLDENACEAGEVKSVEIEGETLFLRTGGLDHDNAVMIRALLPWTAPKCLGLDTSIGLGDRLGLATPGHLRAVDGTGLAPILAQQSIREMTRTQRNADEVMDCATFGVLEYGWTGGFGSDADHLKNTDDIDYCLKAGFTLFTIDPGDHVVNEADGMEPEALENAYASIDWQALECTPEDCATAYAEKEFDLGEGNILKISKEALLRAAVKYSGAVAHTVRLKRHLESQCAGRAYELEMSVDETDSPTSPVEHYYVAAELKRLGVRPVSLAPRFIGAFEKGVDYIGDLKAFEEEFSVHAAIARTLGPYKISLHSGSDKFSVYPIAARHTRGLVHVKTAGTSYLEALRAIAKVDSSLFREILSFARANYEEDKKSYHVSANLEKVLDPARMGDDALASALDQFDTRQAFHVTFGSVLTRKNDNGEYLFRDRFYKALEENEETHYECLKHHLGRHAAPFCK